MKSIFKLIFHMSFGIQFSIQNGIHFHVRHCRLFEICRVGKGVACQQWSHALGVVVIVLLFYVYGKQLRSCRDGQFASN